MVSTTMFVKIVCAAVAVVFLWFAVGNLFSGASDTDQLVACGSLIFALLATLL